jgi:flagellar hook-length control protein FliK
MSTSFGQGPFSLTSGSEVKPTPINMSAVAVEIVSRVRDGLKRFDIRLDPPELGRVDVRLEVDRAGNVSTKLTVERPETLDLMQRDARALERALQQAGLKTDAGGLEFSLRQHADERFAQGQGNPGHGDTQSDRVIAEAGEPAEAVVQGYYRASAFARGGVDITV